MLLVLFLAEQLMQQMQSLPVSVFLLLRDVFVLVLLHIPFADHQALQTDDSGLLAILEQNL